MFETLNLYLNWIIWFLYSAQTRDEIITYILKKPNTTRPETNNKKQTKKITSSAKPFV